MSDETRMILEMLKEGRINATEAAALLEALKAPSGSVGSEPLSMREDRDAAANARRLAREAKLQMKHELRRARDEADEAFGIIRDEIASRVDRDVIGEAVEGGLSKLGILVSGIVSSISGAEFSYPETIVGELPEVDTPTVVIQGVNGRITVQTRHSDEPTYELKVLGRLRASSEAEARAALKGLYTVKTTEQSLVIAAEKVFGQSKTADFSLSLPGGRKYNLELRSTNGSITVGELKLGTARITTTNGKILLCADGEEFVLHSTNGRVEVEGCAALTSCGTVNGRIIYACPRPVSGSASLSTVNGSIRITVPSKSPVEISFSGESRNGSVRSSLSGQEILTSEPRRVGRKLQTRKAGELPPLQFRAKSVVGSIHIDEA